jgi:hypothetical protein
VITLQTKSKFYGIKYPIFCLKTIPDTVTIFNDRICIRKYDSSDWITLDEYVPNKPFLYRYLTQDTGTFTFDYTCHSITQLISNKIDWGIDSSAKIFNLRKKEEFKAVNVKVRKVVKNIIWVDKISYPFELPKNIVIPEDIKNQWVTIVSIDGKWNIHKFYSFYTPIESITL